MLLSEIIDNPSAGDGFFREVVADVESFVPPEGLKSIGFLYRGGNGDLGELLLDVMIAYAIAGVEVVLEVPAEETSVDIPYLISVATNVGFTLSLLPPVDDSEEAFQAYLVSVETCTDAYISQPNVSRYVYPVSNYLEYLFIEAWTGNAQVKPNDEYVAKAFLNQLPKEREDRLKAAMRERIYRYYGGEVGFKTFSKGMLSSISREVVNIAHDLSGPQEQVSPAS
ncbi:hypothetical protein [Thiobacillus denitrificans]|uniref:hypothetical protein n=1 Tax=Thiobacillus denitrificans TaxID=36861 RepID=UPI000368EE12|nr:hypothetical protein [Thiobacillus denitrificans]